MEHDDDIIDTVMPEQDVFMTLLGKIVTYSDKMMTRIVKAITSKITIWHNTAQWQHNLQQ